MTIPSLSHETSDIPVAKTPHGLNKLNGNGAYPRIDIIDIRHDAVEFNLKDEIHKSLRPQSGLKKLPTLLLYSQRGLQLFEEITYLEEYYLTNAEIDVLTRSADDIAKSITSGSMVIELGSGNLRKVSILLQALERAEKDVDYYALDLSLDELRRTLEQVPNFEHVRCHGLHGTYDDGLDWLKLPENSLKPKCVMSLGSSIGNFHRNEAADFLKGFQQVLQSSDSMLIGVDATNDPAKVFHAYNDCEGTTHRFILNGLTQANTVLGEEIFDLEDWKVIGEYVHDVEGGRHQAFYAPIRDVELLGIKVKAGERVQVEQSLKYSELEVQRLWKESGLEEVTKWSASQDKYNVHFLRKQNMDFTTNPRAYAASTIPTFEDWKGLWTVWDVVTRRMIPEGELLGKPIKLRNACIFYLGHIPTFLEIQLNKVTNLRPCEPTNYPAIFERGIDPDVDNPEKCHEHSEIPEQWPPLDEILTFQKKVRSKVRKLYETEDIPRNVGRALWIGFEHEIMHLETLLYMLLQSDKTLPPTATIPDFQGLAKIAKAERVKNQWFKIPEQIVDIGLNDPEDNSGGDVHYGWDNEKPRRTVNVKSFEAHGRPITIEEYAIYLDQTHNPTVPASWVTSSSGPSYTNGYTNGLNGSANGHNSNGSLTNSYLEGKSVRTVYGLVPLEYALDWPVFASYDELNGCANWMGGRIPTAEEARSIYSFADDMKKQNPEQQTTTVPAVNGHLVNNGVEESPPSDASNQGECWSQLFTDLDGANVGFKNWHPVAVTSQGNRLGGQSDMGGVWEWTSTTLAKHEGFEPMPLYPAYTADFFDGKHNIILGGSWATHPRIAGRKTFVNWYQRNYPYVWAGARLVRDIN